VSHDDREGDRADGAGTLTWVADGSTCATRFAASAFAPRAQLTLTPEAAWDRGSRFRVGELDPERGNVNDCALDGVLRRDRLCCSALRNPDATLTRGTPLRESSDAESVRGKTFAECSTSFACEGRDKFLWRRLRHQLPMRGP
jgi:hypothetical protein